MSRIGEAMRAVRTASGLKSREVAEAVALTPQYVRLIECGGAIPSMEATLRIANLYPDVDTAAWLVLLLRDLWGDPVVDLIEQHSVAEARRSGRER